MPRQRRPSRAATTTSRRSRSPRPTPGSTPRAGTGCPSQLLEVGMTGMPIVGTLRRRHRRGADRGRRLAGPGGRAARRRTSRRSRAVLADPADARRRALALRERMLRERTEAGVRGAGRRRPAARRRRGGATDDVTDLTLIVTAHDETLVCGPTMTSADLAVAAARDAGYTVQTIVALDKATEATTEWFRQPELRPLGALGDGRRATSAGCATRWCHGPTAGLHRVPRRRRPVQRELAGRGAGTGSTRPRRAASG